MLQKQSFFIEILESCCSFINIELDDAMGRLRNREFVNARSIAVCVMKNLFPKTTITFLGACIGRDHATIIHYLRRHDDLMFADCEYRDFYENMYQLYKDKKISPELSPYESLLNKYYILSEKHKRTEEKYNIVLEKYKNIESITNY